MPGVLLAGPEMLVKNEPPTRGGAIRHVETYYQFGDVEVDVEARTATCRGSDLRLGTRAFDLLVVLLRMRGTVAEKQRLMHQVWPTTTVDESNLRFQMTCLRRALGSQCDLIKTIPGRGYFFVAANVSVAEAGVYGLAANRLAPSPLEEAKEGPATVAIVEDDEGVRDALDGLLRSSGFLVKAYASPQDFLEDGTVAAECLILDVWLPGRSGLDVQADLNSAGMEVPTIFISGHADVHMSVKAMKAGAVEFLTKPVRHEEILRAVQEAVQSSRGRAQRANAAGMATSAGI